MPDNKQHYRGILKATSLIGGSSLVKMLIGMVRTKFVAVMLGPTGVGLMGVYSSIVGIVSTVSEMGISNSGIRQIAEANGTQDQERIARTVIALRRICWVTGTFGLIIMVAGSWTWSKLSFGSYEHAVPIAFLGIPVLLGAIAGGQLCVLQGTRRLADMAKASVIGSINGTIIAIPCFYFWGIRGIVPCLILGSITTVVNCWWFSRKVPVLPLVIPWKASRNEIGNLLGFGLPIMLSALVGVASAYIIRILLVRQIGLDGVGIYQAAFGISTILVNFVLFSMATDYYPRLTAIANNNIQVNREVNAQTEIALLLAVPALAVTIVFAPIAIVVFYSGKFDDAVPILRWSVYGILGRVISWPLGYVLLSKGESKMFLFTETFFSVVQIAIVWFCTKLWGLPGTGIAFVFQYIFYTFFIYKITQKISKTYWTRACFRHIGIFTLILVLLGLNCAMNKTIVLQWVLSLVTVAGLIFYCLRRLSIQTGITMQSIVRKLKS